MAVTGLSDAQVAERKAKGQVNVTEHQTSRSLASIIRANVLTLFNGVLLAAMVTVALVGAWQDMVFGMVMVLNTLIGVISEWRAKRTLDQLAIVSAPHATVLRGSTLRQVDLEEVVLDDVVQLHLGDQIPVDGVVLEAGGLEVDESLLTGESVPVLKKPDDTVLAGTSVVAGGGLVRATAVGADEWAEGITAQAKQFNLTVSELEVGINKILRVISWCLVPVVILIMWSQLRISVDSNWQHALVLAVAAVVGMIPQGLVLLTSMNFALGSATLARRGVLVQELPAVEILARVDALCLDKTGTLTTGGITLKQIQVAPAGHEQQIRRALKALCADRTNATAEAIDDFLTEQVSAPAWVQPFSSARKWSAVGMEEHGWILGAPEMVCAADDPNIQWLKDTVQASASQGLRVVALVQAQADGTMEELPAGRRACGVVVLEEELRSDAHDTLEWLREQGVRVRIISGDNPTTVGALASRVGFTDPALCDARTLPADFESDEFIDAIDSHDIFGRVTPEQKRAMVHALQSRGHCVAMSGDGVNDALALKDADLGIAMGNGAEATKAVAQIVLVKSSFAALPGIMAEGRRIMANMERVSGLFLTKTVYAAMIGIFVAIIGWSYPFLPRHFTYFDAFTIGIPAFFLALAPNPQLYRAGFLRRVLNLAVPSGIILTVAVMTCFGVVGQGSVQAQTAATITLIVGALFLLGAIARPLLSWRLGLLVLMCVGAALVIIVPFAREFFALSLLSQDQWMIAIGCGLVAGALIVVVSWVMGAVERNNPEDYTFGSGKDAHHRIPLTDGA